MHNKSPQHSSLNPVYNALNKPLMIMGIDRNIFGGILAAFILTFWFVGLIAGVLVFAALFLVARKTSTKDIIILVRGLRMDTKYDSARRV